MTLAEYKADLSAKNTFVSYEKETTDKIDAELRSNEDVEVRFFELGIITKVSTDRYSTGRENVAVENYGEAGEVVRPLLTEKADIDESDTFRDLVRSYLDANYVSDAMPFIMIDQVSEEEQFSICTAYVVTGEQISPKKYLVGLRNSAPYIKEYVE